MDANRLLAECRRRGMELAIIGGRLELRGRISGQPPAFMEAVRADAVGLAKAIRAENGPQSGPLGPPVVHPKNESGPCRNSLKGRENDISGPLGPPKLIARDSCEGKTKLSGRTPKREIFYPPMSGSLGRQSGPSGPKPVRVNEANDLRRVHSITAVDQHAEEWTKPGPQVGTWRNPDCGPEPDPEHPDPAALAEAAAEAEAIRAADGIEAEPPAWHAAVSAWPLSRQVEFSERAANAMRVAKILDRPLTPAEAESDTFDQMMAESRHARGIANRNTLPPRVGATVTNPPPPLIESPARRERQDLDALPARPYLGRGRKGAAADPDAPPVDPKVAAEAEVESWAEVGREFMESAPRGRTPEHIAGLYRWAAIMFARAGKEATVTGLDADLFAGLAGEEAEATQLGTAPPTTTF